MSQSSPGIKPHAERRTSRDLQTAFTAQQLARPEIAEADGILRTCVHYGFCTATCPTYVLFRDENDSPRGRIDLIRAMLEKGGAPDAKTVHHLDRCLSCLSCVTTCAVKVDYAHLIESRRAYIEEQLPPARRRAAAAADAGEDACRIRAASRRRCGWRSWRGRSPVCCRSGCAIWSQLAPSRETADRIRAAAGVSGRRRTRRMRVAAARRLRAAGARSATSMPRPSGVLTAAWLRGGDRAGRGLLRRAAAAYGTRGARARRWRAPMSRPGAREFAAGVDAVVVNASGCGTTVKDYGHLLGGEDAHGASAR